MPATTNDRTTAGPAYCAAAVPVSTKLPESSEWRAAGAWAFLFSIPSQSEAIVRRLARDGHVVRMRLAKAGRRYANELRLRAKRLDRRASNVAHAASQAADHLKEDVAD